MSNDSPPIRILAVDDHQLIRVGIATPGRIVITSINLR
jgi:hypothetical protein